MVKNKFVSIAKDVINLEIKALQKLKKNINSSFNDAVIHISKLITFFASIINFFLFINETKYHP